LGYVPEALLGRSYLRIVHPEERARVTAEVARAAAGAGKQSLTFRALHADGRKLWLETSGVRLTDAQGRIKGAVFSSRDVTERYRAEQALRRESGLRQELLKLTNELLGDELGEGFYQRLLDRAVVLVPGAQAGSLLMRDEDDLYRFKAAVGYDLALLQTLSLSESELGRRNLVEPELVQYDVENRSLEPEKQRVFDEGGRVRDIKITLSTPITLAGRLSGFFNLDNFERANAFGSAAFEVAQALAGQAAIALQRLTLESQLKAERSRYQHLAVHDALTGLPNRRLFNDRLEQVLSRAHRRQAIAGLALFDLDGFKSVNDTLGHDVGDLLLQHLAKRLLGAIRAEDTLARLGGDEFAVIFNELAHAADAELVIRKLFRALEEPFVLSGRCIRISASFGVSLYPQDATAASELLKCADLALYRRKGQAKRGYAFFDDSGLA
jgi:diguanylate cyclase (GGDEF)-like protein/PAS domain S-box-containing protein